MGERDFVEHRFVGLEFDWIAVDASGRVALFSTAGSGYVPPSVLVDADGHDAALAAILETPAVTTAAFTPQVGPGCVNTWRLVAERGLFAYDSDCVSANYRLVAAPTTARLIDELPEAARARLAVAFRTRNALGQCARLGPADLTDAAHADGD